MSVFVWWKVLAAAAAVHLLGPRLAWAGGSGEVGGGGPELADVYEETLTLRPLPDARTVATFRFAVDSPYSRGDHFDVFPKALGQVVISSGVRAFNLAITKGTWDYDVYGDLSPDLAGPPGAELRRLILAKTAGRTETGGPGSRRHSEASSARHSLRLMTLPRCIARHRRPCLVAIPSVFCGARCFAPRISFPLSSSCPAESMPACPLISIPFVTAQADFMSLSVRVRRSEQGASTKLNLDIGVVLVLPSSSGVDNIPSASFDLSRDLLGDDVSATLPQRAL